MVLEERKIKRLIAWFLIWYSLEAMLIFFIAIGNLISPESNINAPINALFFASTGSLVWPGVVLLSFIRGAFVTLIFMFIYGSIVISAITSLILEYKYNICYPVLFGLLRRINEKVIREISAGFFVWYIFEAILILSLGVLYSVFSIHTTSDLIEVLFIINIISVIWPIIIFVLFFLVDASSSNFFLVFIGSSLIFLITSLIIEYKCNFTYSKIFDLIDRM